MEVTSKDFIDNIEVTDRKPVLKWRDYLKVSLRSYCAQDAFNYGTYLGHGWAYCLLPAFQKMYKNNKEELIDVTLDNTEFFNTNMQMMPFISSLYLAMLDNGESIDECRSIKMALMGPIGGIAGSCFQFGLAPIFASIGASLATDGLILGPIFFFLAINLAVFVTKILVGYYGYKLGTDVLDALKERMYDITQSAYIIGVTVISGLVVSFTHITLGIQYVTQVDGKEQAITLQSVLDKIAPNMLPVILAAVVFFLIRKRNFSMYKLLALIFGIGIIGSVLGIFIKG